MIVRCPGCNSQDISQSPNLQCPECEKAYCSESQSEEGEWHNEGEDCPRCKQMPWLQKRSVDYDAKAKCPPLILRTHPVITFPK